MSLKPDHQIVIIGAGPIGLEAALYGRYLGYSVQVFESRQVAHHVQSWGHVQMFTPFRMNCSPLGLAALAAQDPDSPRPDLNMIPTGHQWVDHYLAPLAHTDLLRSCIQYDSEVLAVSRPGSLKTDAPGTDQRTQQPFRVLVKDRNGNTQTTSAQTVIDASGVYATPNWLGPGGAPASGEMELAKEISYEVPELPGQDETHYANQHTLVVGAGYSAATTVVRLACLQQQYPETRITWVTRAPGSDGPLRSIPGDSLPERSKLVQTANQLVTDNSLLEHLGGMCIESITREEQSGAFQVELVPVNSGDPQTRAVDRIIANVGYRPNHHLYEELHVHQCYATSGPMKLAVTLMEHDTGDCLEQAKTGPEALMTPEHNFYILGSKSYGRNPRFLLQHGLQQIQQVFTMIGERADLDLYSTMNDIIERPD